MGPPSIRVRLTAWYGVVLAATFIVLGMAVYLVMGHALLGRIDAVLAFEYEETVERIKGGETPEALGTGPAAFHQNYVLRVRDGRGRIWAESRPPTGATPPPAAFAELGLRTAPGAVFSTG